MPLQAFHSAVAAWFNETFTEPTPAQRDAWPAISAGRHVLVAAPTGSGKTLAAFLAAITGLVGLCHRLGLLPTLFDPGVASMQGLPPVAAPPARTPVPPVEVFDVPATVPSWIRLGQRHHFINRRAPIRGLIQAPVNQTFRSVRLILRQITPETALAQSPAPAPPRPASAVLYSSPHRLLRMALALGGTMDVGRPGPAPPVGQPLSSCVSPVAASSGSSRTPFGAL